MSASATQIQALKEGLKDSHSQTLAYFDLADAALNKSYAQGKWSVRYILHHIADAESVLYDRVRRVISSPKSVIWSFDQDAWATGLDYANLDLGLSKAMYSAVRLRAIYHIEKNYGALGDKEFVHSETGLKTLKDEMEKMLWHNTHHLQQIATALAT